MRQASSAPARGSGWKGGSTNAVEASRAPPVTWRG
ncbi:Uncharacterised protein [Mycobacteroides abscessus]|nr:Uncharacterised protein [Mycobacteroides abscessus]